MSTLLVRCFLRRSLLIWTLPVVFLKLPTGQCWRVVNGAVGESAVLSGTNDSIRVTNLQWVKSDIIIMQRFNGSITIYNQAYEGRLTLSEGDGSLTINPLIKNDSGEYTFESLPPPWPQKRHVIQLNVYDRIVSVEMDPQVSYSPDNSTCNVTLSCTVKGSVVELSWSKDHKKIPDTEGKETLVVTPTAGEELYSCTASNPVSSQTASLRVSSCQTHAINTSMRDNTSGTVCSGQVSQRWGCLGRILDVIFGGKKKQNLRNRTLECFGLEPFCCLRSRPTCHHAYNEFNIIPESA
nr:T-lymphocyte surface antigen Ly-9-like isoform X2 [Paramormyrops kingsleyae]